MGLSLAQSKVALDWAVSGWFAWGSSASSKGLPWSHSITSILELVSGQKIWGTVSRSESTQLLSIRFCLSSSV